MNVAEMLRAGLALIPIPRGQKGPRSRGWNERNSVITDPADAYRLSGCNVGLAHAYCTPQPTCALDFDDIELALDWLEKKGMDINSLYSQESSVVSTSGQEGRMKIYFRLPEGEDPLPTQQVLVNGKVVLEFRCASKDGKTVQDVLPPSIHPSGRQYEWVTDVPPSAMPTLPQDYLNLWKGLTSTSPPSAPSQSIFNNVPDYIKQLGPSDLMLQLAGYGESDKPSVELIVGECAQVREAMKSGGQGRSEPLWRADIGLIKHTDGGEFACHQASSKHPSYSHDETERKIEAYKAGPTSCEHYHQLNPEPCDACRYRGRIKSPIVLGKSHPAQEIVEALRADAPTSNRKPFQILSAHEVLSKPVSARKFLLTDLLPQFVIAGLVAAGGTGKSMLAMHIGVAIAGGTSLFGRFIAPKVGKVVFLSGEDDVQEIHRRLERIVSVESPLTQQNVKENLYLIDRSEQFDLFTRKLGVGEAEITQVVEELASAIRKQVAPSIDLLIVDPAARFRGGEENSASDVNRFIQTLYQLRESLDCTVLVLHHVNKGSKGNGASQNNARGSSAFADGVRLMLEMTPTETPELVILSCVKSNYGKRPDPISLLQHSDGTFTLSGVSSQDICQIAVLRELSSAGMTKQAFKNRFGKKDGKLGLSERKLREILDELEARGMLTIEERKPIRLTSSGEKLLASV